MSTLANSIEWVDDSLDVGFKELNTFLDNNVYSVRKDIEDTIFGYAFGALDTLKNITNQIKDTIRAIAAIPQKIANEIQKIIDRVMNELLNFDFINGWVRSVATELKLISQEGVKAFLMGATAAGSVVLCANMDILKDLIEGWTVPEHILEGLFMGLSLDWMNRICKDISHQEEMRMSNKEKMESVYPWGGIQADNNNVVTMFGGIVSGFFDASNGYRDPKVELKDKNFFKTSIEGKKSIFEIQKEMGDIETIEQKETYMCYLNEIEQDYYNERTKKRTLNTTIPQKEMRLLELRGDLSRTNPISRERLMQKSNYNNVHDVLGSFIKNLKDIDLNAVHTHKLSQTEKDILIKLKSLQSISKEVDFLTRKHGKDQFADYDFTDTLSIFTDSEIQYMCSLPPHEFTMRYNSLHPTAEMFIQDNVYYTRKNDDNPVGI